MLAGNGTSAGKMGTGIAGPPRRTSPATDKIGRARGDCGGDGPWRVPAHTGSHQLPGIRQPAQWFITLPYFCLLLLTLPSDRLRLARHPPPRPTSPTPGPLRCHQHRPMLVPHSPPRPTPWPPPRPVPAPNFSAMPLSPDGVTDAASGICFSSFSPAEVQRDRVGCRPSGHKLIATSS